MNCNCGVIQLCCIQFGSAEKEMDFAEQIESVAYVLCGDGTILFEKFVSIWKARGVSAFIDLQIKSQLK